MITSIHTLIYSDDPPATRAFLRDVLGWPYVEDVGSEPGWLIFRTGPSELGVHPTSGTWEGADFSHSVHHEISLMCDDIVATKADLEARGAVFAGGHHGRGLRSAGDVGATRGGPDPALRTASQDGLQLVDVPRPGTRPPDLATTRAHPRRHLFQSGTDRSPARRRLQGVLDGLLRRAGRPARRRRA